MSISQEQMCNEISYHKAQELIKKLLDKDLITIVEYDKITELNKQSFCPIFAEIY